MSKIIDKSEIEKEGASIIYKKCFIPEKDSSLQRLGIEVCAVTIISPENKVTNRIVFKRGDNISEVDCIHTAVCQLTPSRESKTGFKVISLEEAPEDLFLSVSPEDNYFAIKSFTQALVENGIQDTLIEGIKREFETGEAPIDMNALMRQQITRALLDIAPEETKELALSSLAYISAGDYRRFDIFSKDFTEIICHHFDGNDLRKLNQINGGLREVSEDIRHCLIMKLDELDDDIARILFNDKNARYRLLWLDKYKQPLPPDIMKKMAEDEDEDVRYRVLERMNIPLDIIEILSMDRSIQIKGRLAQRSNLPNDVILRLSSDLSHLVRHNLVTSGNYLGNKILRKLSYDPVTEIRMAVAVRVNLPQDIIRHLVNDRSPRVRRLIAENSDLPNSLLKKLTEDPDQMVRLTALGRIDRHTYFGRSGQYSLDQLKRALKDLK